MIIIRKLLLKFFFIYLLLSYIMFVKFYIERNFYCEPIIIVYSLFNLNIFCNMKGFYCHILGDLMKASFIIIKIFFMHVLYGMFRKILFIYLRMYINKGNGIFNLNVWMNDVLCPLLLSLCECMQNTTSLCCQTLLIHVSMQCIALYVY